MKKLTRTPDDRWIGGVCGGIAAYTGVDATVIRLLVVAGTLLGAGSLILAYVVAWVMIPRHPDVIWSQAADAPATPSGPPPPSV